MTLPYAMRCAKLWIPGITKNNAKAQVQRHLLPMLPHGLILPFAVSLPVLVAPSELFVGDNTGSVNYYSVLPAHTWCLI